METDIADCDSSFIISMNVANPRRKVTIITLANISQRKGDVRYSGYFELSAILLSIHTILHMLNPPHCIYAMRKLLSLAKKVNTVAASSKFADIKPMSEWFNFVMVKHDMRGKKNRTVVMLTDILIIFIYHHTAVY